MDNDLRPTVADCFLHAIEVANVGDNRMQGAATWACSKRLEVVGAPVISCHPGPKAQAEESQLPLRPCVAREKHAAILPEFGSGIIKIGQILLLACL